MSKIRRFVLALAIAGVVGSGVARVEASNLYANSNLYNTDHVDSDSGDYRLQVAWQGPTLGLTMMFSYIGSNPYDIWTAFGDSFATGGGNHQDQWGYADIDGFASMQGDGNFVLYSSGSSAVWATGTNGYSGAYLNVQNDGNFVIYSGTTPLWSLW